MEVWLLLRKLSQPLAVNITLALAAGLMIVLAVSAWFMTGQMSRDYYKITEEKTRYLLSTQADNAARPLWTFDSSQLQAIVDNLIEGDLIYNAAVLTHEGVVEAFAQKDLKIHEKDSRILEHDIVYLSQDDPVSLGVLRVTVDYSSLVSEIKATSVEILAIMGLLFMVLIAIVYIVSKKAIQPVSILSQAMSNPSVACSELIHDPGSHVIEVQQLYAALRKMQEAYRAYNKELTAQKEMAEIARDQAHKSSQAKSDFLANMSHELRTPLNSIIGMITILYDEEIRHEQREMLSVVQRASHMLLETVNDVLDLSKIENDALTLERIAFDFSHAVIEVIDSLAPIASKKGVTLNCTIDKDLASFVYGDPLRVKRVLNNLVGNAVKYTPNGFVDVSVKQTVLSEDKVRIYCSIRDSGIGIPKNKLNYIFEKFTQADETTTRKFGGTGLGLAITKELVDMMGGSITVDSVVGEGSEFSFAIPFDVAANSTEEALDVHEIYLKNRGLAVHENLIPAREANLLLAEDHELNQVFIKKFLSTLGVAHLTIVSNGLDVIEKYKEQEFDLIFMDCHMPEMNGYEATKIIRELEVEKGEGNPIPIIAMTADAMVGSREKCLEWGMDDFLSKPIEKEAAIAVLSRWIDFSGKKVAPNGGKSKNMSDYTTLPVIDISMLEAYADSDEEKRSLAEVFIAQSLDSIETLKNHCVDGECAPWVEAAHKLKGGAGMIGAEKLRFLCAQAQDMSDVRGSVRQSQLDGILKVFEELKQYFHDSL